MKLAMLAAAALVPSLVSSHAPALPYSQPAKVAAPVFTDPNCTSGMLSADKTVCCPKSCGECGGGSCNTRPGGKENCCELEIKATGKACSQNDAPCVVVNAPAPAPPTGLRFATTYGDSMVLQQSPAQAVVWGYCGAAGCSDVRVQLDDASPQDTSAGGLPGTWIAKLPATEGGPAAHNVTVTDGSSNVTLTDVLFGDVWVCSGQSNMAFLLENSFNGSAFVNNSINFPMLRMFTSKKDSLKVPQFEQPVVEEQWSVSSPKAVSMNQAGVDDDNWLYMSAVCYMYGLEIHQRTGKPVGLVNTNWGGTPVEFWMSADATSSCAEGEAAGGAYNGMIQPLLNMTIFGAIWYQGEANSGDPLSGLDFQGLPLSRYACTFPAMINDWRSKFHEGSLGETSQNFFFGFVQLASWISDIHPASTRWGQLGGFPGLPNTRMGNNTFDAIAIDLTDRTSPFGSVHIRDKQTVAQRLAAGGLAVAYGQTDYWQGPVADSAHFNQDGSVTVYFSNCGGAGLELRNSSGWQLCLFGGANNCSQISDPVQATSASAGDWVLAAGRVDPQGASKVTVSAETNDWRGGDGGSGGQVLIRYAWAGLAFEYLNGGVYAKAENFPAGPFVLRTLPSH